MLSLQIPYAKICENYNVGGQGDADEFIYNIWKLYEKEVSSIDVHSHGFEQTTEVQMLSHCNHISKTTEIVQTWMVDSKCIHSKLDSIFEPQVEDISEKVCSICEESMKLTLQKEKLSVFEKEQIQGRAKKTKYISKFFGTSFNVNLDRGFYNCAGVERKNNSAISLSQTPVIRTIESGPIKLELNAFISHIGKKPNAQGNHWIVSKNIAPRGEPIKMKLFDDAKSVKNQSSCIKNNNKVVSLQFRVLAKKPELLNLVGTKRN